MKTSMQMTGLRELGQAFAALDLDIQKKTGRNAVTAGANVIKKQAIVNAPELSASTPTRNKGTLKKSIRSKGVKKRNGMFEARVWVKGIGTKKIAAFKSGTGKQARDNPDDPYFWWWTHFGTAHSAPNPFITRAYEQKKAEAAEKIKSNLANRIDKEAKRIGRTIGKVK